MRILPFLQECLGDPLPLIRQSALEAMRLGYGMDLIAIDRDLDSIRRDPRFLQIVSAAATMSRSASI